MACYFIEPEGINLRKIGSGWCAQNRLRSQMGMSPVKLTLAAWDERGDYMTEAQLHWRFRDQHSHSEWFRMSAELSRVIEETRDTGSIPGAWYFPEGNKGANGSGYAVWGDTLANVAARMGVSMSLIKQIISSKQHVSTTQLCMKHIPILCDWFAAQGTPVSPYDFLIPDEATQEAA